jgi:hypothetical protein
LSEAGISAWKRSQKKEQEQGAGHKKILGNQFTRIGEL